MKAITVNTQLFNTAIHTPRTVSVSPFAALTRALGKIAITIQTKMERQDADNEEKKRQGILKRFRGNQAQLPSASFRFDRSRDDVFSPLDS